MAFALMDASIAVPFLVGESARQVKGESGSPSHLAGEIDVVAGLLANR
jgi:hypothetical protein